MNEIQLIRQQLATERLHFAEVSKACAAALASDKFAAGSDFANASADYLAFAASRLGAGASPALEVPASAAKPELWRNFLAAFDMRSRQHFETLDELAARNPLVTEWRAASRIDADSIFAERARYGRFKAAVP